MPQTSGLIDFFLHPPLAGLSSHAVAAAPFTGFANTIVAFNGVIPVSTTYGVYVTPDVVPVPWGREDGWQGPGSESGDLYIPRIGQVIVQHQLASGLYVTTQITDIVQPGQLVLWDVALPARLGVVAEPGVSLGMYYLS